jgi:nondiscriminating glutamyl-tRNA synthetase
MSEGKVRLRFAPSPTGRLHVGNARTALFNWLLARHTGGTFILRIEDSDAQRSSLESEAGILDDLRWLGLDWDEGPGVGGGRGPYRQSERLALYRSHAELLLADGRAYFCFCPPEQLDAERQAALAAGRAPQYSGACRGLDPGGARARVAAGEPAVVRFRVPQGREIVFEDLVRGTVAVHTGTIGDPVMLRSDGRPAYNFAVVVDDALMSITHVVRGEDHISNTPRQLLFYEAFRWAPPRFAHVALVMGPDHTPLSKRHGATSVAEFRAKGYLPEAVVNHLALIGWSPGGGAELLPVRELANRFSLESVGHSAAVFDEEKLAWVNRHYLKEADPARLVSLALPYLVGAGMVLGDPGLEARRFLADIMPIASGSVDRLDQIPDRLKLLFRYDPSSVLARPDARQELTQPGARQVIAALAEELAREPRLRDRQAFRACAERIRQHTGQKGRSLFHPIRLALTAASDGPELDLLVPAIDRGAELERDSGLSPIPGCRERAAQFADAVRASLE